MTPDQAFHLLGWTITVIVGVPTLWLLWDILRHH
jgi:hypothetical protein